MPHRDNVYTGVLDAAIKANLIHRSSHTQSVVEEAAKAEVRVKQAIEVLSYGGMTTRTAREARHYDITDAA